MSEEMKNLNNEPEKAPVEKKPLDKKTLGIIIGAVAAVLVIVLVLVLALGGNQTPETPDDGGEQGGEQGGNGEENNPPVLNDYTLGLGVVVNLDSSETALAEVDATVATVVLDKDGKIVACRLDVAQNKVDVTDGFVTVPGSFKTKMELGSAYGMGQAEITEANKWMDNNGDGRVLEWNEQAKAFEAWCVGKTVAQVEALGAEENLQNANNHWFTKDEDLLSAGCTIQIGDFVGAVVKACNDEFKVSFQSEGNFTLGLGVDSYDDGSVDADAENGTVMVYSDMAAVVIDNGIIVASLNDAIQPKISFDVAGEITAKTFNGTKRELKEGYHMGQAEITEANKWMDNNGDGKVYEWYVQSAAFSAHIVGKTAADVESMPTQTLKNGYVISNDQDLLAAGCTIQISAIVDVVVEAAANAR